MKMRLMRSLAAAAVVASAGLSISVTAEPAYAVVTQADKTEVALIEIHGPLHEQAAPLSWLTGGSEHPTLRNIVQLIHDVANDTSLKALVIRLREAELQMTQIEELSSAIKRVRDAGKKVHLFADGYSTPELVLGSHCDEVTIQTGGGVMFPGMYMEEMYLADTMAWAGLKPQMVQVGDYKGANEQMMRSAPSPQWDQNINGLLDSMYGNVRAAIKSGRKLDDAKLDEAMRQNWMSLADTAKKTGLVDAIIDLPGLSKHLETAYGSEISWTNFEIEKTDAKLDMSNPFAMLSKLTSQPRNSPTRDALAIVYINGPIMDGESQQGGLMGGSSVGSTTIRRALSEIEDEDLFKGVVVRVDSPGGSAIASEVIWQGIRRLSEKKPVWISVGSMAASGGYYCLVAGQKVYVNPSSIVGSIGVVGGKVSMTGLFDKAKIKTVGRERGPMGRMLASSAPWTEAEQGFVRAKMTETYELFTSRVSAGRKGIDLSKTAEGRLFTGNDAVKLNMADKIGGLDDAITDLAAELKLAEGEYQTFEFPGPKGLSEILGEMLGGMASAPSVGAAIGEQAGPAMVGATLKELVGEKHWPQVRDQMTALMQLRTEPVLLTSPKAILVK